MKQVFISLAAFLLVLASMPAQAQSEYQFYAEQDVFDWDVLKKDSFGVYVAVPADFTKIVYVAREKRLYRLLDDKYGLLEEGRFGYVADKKYGRIGQWSSYYPGGKLKSRGYYEAGKPVGLWKKYYPGGQLMAVYSYGLLDVKGTKYYDMIGAYQEFYENGQVKVDGFYKMSFDTAVRDMIYREDPKTKKPIIKESKGEIPHTVQSGTWYYYTENGELLKTEEH